eukprot:scaffold297839_cov24-Prasinocladus_malaysianus.AAC.1
MENFGVHKSPSCIPYEFCTEKLVSQNNTSHQLNLLDVFEPVRLPATGCIPVLIMDDVELAWAN